MSMIFNRLQKNLERLQPWATAQGLEAFRLYDWDIPEFPFFIDKYQDCFVISDKSRETDRDKKNLLELQGAIESLFDIKKSNLFIKERRKKSKEDQYQKLAVDQKLLTIREGDLKFKVNLSDYLDTGLFLDHRPLRSWLQKISRGSKVLNLFCYTGSLSVAAASAGAWVTSLDLSKTYISWAQDNFNLNDIPAGNHRFFRQDAISYLKNKVIDKYEVIILDPPTFSQSKKMDGDLDIQRDHTELVRQCVARLTDSGVLYFSTNRVGFKLNPELEQEFQIKDVTQESIPLDFSKGDIHQCFAIYRS